MCGIFGLIVSNENNYRHQFLKNDVARLFKLSETRGKEASGISIINDSSIKVLKDNVIAKKLIKTDSYQHLFSDLIKNHNGGILGVIGHSRLVTNGNQNVYNNNQPVVYDDVIGVHNGIIVNDKQIWLDYDSLIKNSDVDSEIIFALINMFLRRKNNLSDAVLKTFEIIEGNASIAGIFKQTNSLILYTNNGSLYYAADTSKNIFVFGSEKVIIEKFIKKRHLKKKFIKVPIKKIKPNSGLVVNLLNLNKISIPTKELNNDYNANSREVILFKTNETEENFSKIETVNFHDNSQQLKFDDYINSLNARVADLRRCKKCILPETMPFIKFDNDGICNFCKSHQYYKVDDYNILLDKIKTSVDYNRDPNCLMALSGGRDSCFGLHYAVNSLKLKPIAYTYDWGLITDLARRNISRMCSSLGIEHILVSADINKKRRHVQKKVLAWLRKPNLGMVPLFQSGDKQYFYYLKKVLSDNLLDFTLYTENPLEKTNFKTGFAGVFEGNNKNSRVYDISILNKINLGLFFSKQFLTNISYLNSSIFDTFGSYLSSFFINHNFEFFYNYYKWNEDEVNKVLIDEYDWELAKDSSTTWRIGDGTAPFYNYIYYVMAGFTENDTLRSNQIREGLLSREKALDLVYNENQPRWDSIKWYCDTINISFKDSIEIINKANKVF